jgi:hypothetical protein
VAHEAFLRSISLPLYSAMTDAEVERVIAAVFDVIGAHRHRRRPRPPARGAPER